MTQVVLPNVRKLIIPDPSYVMIEADLKGADAQVVAWEAEDEDLKAAFRAGLDVHAKNAEDMLGTEFTRLPPGTHAYEKVRQDNKKAVHLTNYGGSARTCAVSLGWTIHSAEKFQRRWFSLHPNIKLRYHDRVRASLEHDKVIRNRFGFRREFFDRLDSCFAEALAWIPQSTVALNTYRGALQLEAQYWPHQLVRGWTPTARDLAGMLLQTHDSINFQFPYAQLPQRDELQRVLSVPIPYEDPLTIQWDIKKSTKSWGDLEKWK